MRVRSAGIAILFLLGAGLLTRMVEHAGVLPKKADHAQLVRRSAPVEISTDEQPAVGTDTVDLKTGNLHLTIPVVASSKPKQ